MNSVKYFKERMYGYSIMDNVTAYCYHTEIDNIKKHETTLIYVRRRDNDQEPVKDGNLEDIIGKRS